MPPKKAPQPEQELLWGRPKNNLSMAIVGMPNVGKSTTFNIMSKLSVPAENYPFCTIDPNTAKINVPDERFLNLTNFWKPKSKVAATLSIVDIAGLVRGASTGEGLGNNFLSNINACDGIFHVVRAFDDPDIVHQELDVDPVRDMDIITKELALKDIQILSKQSEDLEKKIKQRNLKEDVKLKTIIDKCLECLNSGKWVRNGTWTNIEIEEINDMYLLTAKPMIYLVNLSVEDFEKKKNKWLPKIAAWVKENSPGMIIPYSADFERNWMLEHPKMTLEEEIAPSNKSMMPKIIKNGFKLLDLQYFFTCGADEVKCWTIKRNKKAPQAAGVIHTDFEKGFIMAEVYKYSDFMEHGTEAALKAKGLYFQKGKDYVVEDGDIIFFKFNVSKGK